MELICPSCKTRYLVPDEAVTEAGRQVSCTECGHGWQAFPPLELGAESAAPTPEAGAIGDSSSLGSSPADAGAEPQDAARTGLGRPGSGRPRSIGAPSAIQGQSPMTPAGASPQPDEVDAPEALSGSAAAPGTPKPSLGASTSTRTPSQHPGAEAATASNPIRQQQLAEIRKMLAEVQSGRGEAGAPPAHDQQKPGVSGALPATPLADTPAGPDLQEQKDAAPSESQQQAESRINDDGSGAKESERQAAEQRQAHPETEEEDPDYVAPPGFLRTGILVILLIAAAMTVLYVLQPQITSRLPSTGPALTKYIEMIDKLRAHITLDYEWAKSKITQDSDAHSTESENPAGTALEAGRSNGGSSGGSSERSPEASSP